MPLIAPAAARELVLQRVEGLAAEAVPLAAARGRVLAEDLASVDDVPSFDNSAMDGYAVCAADTRGASSSRPVSLRVVDDSRAGAPARRGPDVGEAVRISTGAMLPEGADAVVRIEDTAVTDGTVEVRSEVDPGTDIRRAGDDIRAGDIVLRAGTRLEAAELGVAASVGAASVPCAKRPRVAIVTTGDELVSPDAELRPGQIRNTNRYAIAALVESAGGEVVSAQGAADDLAATLAVLERALDADVAVVTGGVSVGPHDHVKPALAQLGVEEVFWGVALRPGKPTWFGVKKAGIPLAGNPRSSEGSRLVFGLPGNPVSAIVTFHLFVAPALAALQGASNPIRRAPAIFDEDYRKSPGRAHVVRCRLEARADGWHVRPTGAQGSHVLTSMLGAEALAHLDVERGDVRAGERVEIEIL